MAVREAVCRCGLRVRRDDVARKISHELPECDWFRGLIDAERAQGGVVDRIEEENERGELVAIRAKA